MIVLQMETVISFPKAVIGASEMISNGADRVLFAVSTIIAVVETTIWMTDVAGFAASGIMSITETTISLMDTTMSRAEMIVGEHPQAIENVAVIAIPDFHDHLRHGNDPFRPSGNRFRFAGDHLRIGRNRLFHRRRHFHVVDGFLSDGDDFRQAGNDRSDDRVDRNRYGHDHLVTECECLPGGNNHHHVDFGLNHKAGNFAILPGCFMF
jgi:hypothetical protein